MSVTTDPRRASAGDPVVQLDPVAEWRVAMDSCPWPNRPRVWPLRALEDLAAAVATAGRGTRDDYALVAPSAGGA